MAESVLAAHPRFETSRLLSATAERDRLEDVLLMLPGTLGEFSADRLGDVLVAAACRLSGARLAVVELPDLLPAPIVGGQDAPWLDERFSLQRFPIAEQALAGSLVHVPDIAELAPAAKESHEAVTLDGRVLRCVLAVPIGSAAVSGALMLAHHRAHAFSDRQVALVRALVAHLGQAIEICDAVSSQTRVATALQESLLPPLMPRIPRLAASYRPSGSGNLVGGDFYDVFPDAGGGWYLLLGDASGVGPEAAGLAGIARYTARALADPAPPPSQILAQMNVALLRAATDGRFCTAVLARFDADDGDGGGGRAMAVALGSSGHPPALVLRASGAIEQATEVTGTLLGILAGAPVGEASLHLEPGDAIVFYTDGVLEARDTSGEQFGEQRLAETLSCAIGRSAEGVARRLERAVLDHRAASVSDDLAILVARVRPESVVEPSRALHEIAGGQPTGAERRAAREWPPRHI